MVLDVLLHSRKEIRAVEDRLGRQIQSDRKEEAGCDGANPLKLPVFATLIINGFYSTSEASPTVRCSVFHFNQC